MSERSPEQSPEPSIYLNMTTTGLRFVAEASNSLTALSKIHTIALMRAIGNEFDDEAADLVLLTKERMAELREIEKQEVAFIEYATRAMHEPHNQQLADDEEARIALFKQG